MDFQWDASRLFFKRHSITLGSEYRQDIRQHQANYDVQPYFSYLDDTGPRMFGDFTYKTNLT